MSITEFASGATVLCIGTSSSLPAKGYGDPDEYRVPNSGSV
ncbi:MAG TPA: hypothetical protein VJ225_05815 [Nitrososphaeraceae archaeon]|nr:hypothetical protein [Nitrososphaeraceae archaeon]